MSNNAGLDPRNIAELAKLKRKNDIEEIAEASSVIGIDLGTTFSCAAVWKNNEVKIITVNGDRTIPSVVAYLGDDRLVGRQALKKMQQKKFSEKQIPNVIFDVKRLIGKKVEDKDISSDINSWPYKVVEGRNGNAAVQVNINGEKKVFSPEEVCANILIVLKNAAEQFLDRKINGAVISVPAYYNDQQRQSTIDAGKIAGLDVLGLINEPTAAALTYAFLEKKNKGDAHLGKQNLLVFDLGGGTFDVTILQHDHGIVEVLATVGDGHLGGIDFDRAIAKYFDKQFKAKYGKSMMDNPLYLTKLLKACQEVKHDLTTRAKVDFFIDAYGEDFESSITRATFEDLCKPLFEKCIKVMNQCITQAKITKNEIDDVVLVGGSTNVPKIRELVKEFFDGRKMAYDVDANEAIAIGCAIRAAHLVLTDRQKKGTLLADLKVIDVIPLNLGVRIKGGKMHVIVPAQSPIPYVSKTMRYKTTKDKQRDTEIFIYEGQHEYVKDNKLLGKFYIDGLPEKKAGEVKIDIRMKVDKNGIVDVTAVTSENITAQLKISRNKGTFSDKELRQMRMEAQRFEQKERLKEKLAQATDRLENLILTKKKAAESLPSKEKQKQMEKLDRIHSWLQQNSKVVTDSTLKQVNIFYQQIE